MILDYMGRSSLITRSLKIEEQGKRMSRRDAVLKGLDLLSLALKWEKGMQCLWKLRTALSLQPTRKQRPQYHKNGVLESANNPNEQGKEFSLVASRKEQSLNSTFLLAQGDPHQPSDLQNRETITLDFCHLLNLW